MAIYSDTSPLRKAPGFPFEETWRPGDRPMLAGIYRCVCGAEVPLPLGEALPGAEHRHQPRQGLAEWSLCVATEGPSVVALDARAKPFRPHPKPAIAERSPA